MSRMNARCLELEETCIGARGMSLLSIKSVNVCHVLIHYSRRVGMCVWIIQCTQRRVEERWLRIKGCLDVSRDILFLPLFASRLCASSGRGACSAHA